MKDIGLESLTDYKPSVKTALEQDVTIVMPFYDRIKYLKHYLGEGLWDGFRIQLVCDGSPENVVKSLGTIPQSRAELSIHTYPKNRGVAYARSASLGIVTTPYLVFCDDDDFIIDGHSFLNKAQTAMQDDANLLFYGMRNVYAFNERLEVNKQYDRCIFHGRTGRELLIYMVQTGEISVLSLGSVFRVHDLRGTEPESFFKVSEDYVFLARLCAKYPDRKIFIDQTNGGYLRLTEHDSLSSREAYSVEKIVMHYVSMFVGAYYLGKMRGIAPDGFKHVLRKRGALLQASYRKGAELSTLMIQLYEKKNVETLRNSNLSDEQRLGLQFLEANLNELPAEFCSMVNWEVNAPGSIY